MKALLLSLLLSCSLGVGAQEYGDIAPFGCTHLVSDFWPKPPHGILVFQGQHMALLCQRQQVFVCTFYSTVYNRHVNVQVDYEVWCCAKQGERYRMEW